MRLTLLSFAVSCALCVPVMAAEITVDGRVDPAEWQGAHHVTDFRKVQPLTGAPATHATEAWVLATPQGLAVAFRNVQPADTRTRQRVRRDFKDQVDRVNLMIDFDGDGRTGYDFTVAATGDVADAVITNEFMFKDDWDGSWKHAVAEDAQGWSVEMLIPWHIAPMRKGKAGMRQMKIYLDRVLGSTGERVAWPTASFEKSRFLSEFNPIEVPQYSQSLLAVTPYVSGLYDNVRSDSDMDAGVDVFWKPNGQFQLTATVNPDFGQVESDDLVVNFSATETFISDKRPFFTENQGFFEYTTPSDFSQLLYTRRVGGPTDDGQGAGDITAAVKVNGSWGQTKYGIFAADEADEAGRSFYALRLVRDFSDQNLGMMMTRVERPYLDRTANVLGVDHNWRPNARWNIRSRVFGSQIEQYGDSRRDLGATVWADYEMDHGWRQQWIAMHFGNDLQINDAGYLARNSLNYLHWELKRRFTDMPDSSRYASKEWRWRASSVYNNHGDRLKNQFRVSRQGQLRNGANEYGQLNLNTSGVDDQLTRGHGVVNVPVSFDANYEYTRPRKGNWAHEIYAGANSQGLAGVRKPGFNVEYKATYFISDAFSLYGGFYVERSPDWLLWQQDNLIGSFAQRLWQINAGLTWTLSARQELRVKLQSIALDARARQAYRVETSGHARPSQEAIDDFSLSNLGFQIRYRYELAPLSYLYVVYGRGGSRDNRYGDGPGSLLGDAFSLRDDEQLMIKLSYRFER